MDAIQTFELTRDFGHYRAVDSLNLQIKQGELFGLLGPNGAGKTTTIRMLCTILAPTSGTAGVAGFDIVKQPDKVRSKIGVVSESVALYKDLTAFENLKLLGELYNIPRQYLRQRINQLLDPLDLKGRANDVAGTFSTGMMKRLHFAAALIHEPEVLFFDEVTGGLDPQSATTLREFTKQLCRDGITVIWTTHYMFEPERLCDRVAIINRGRIAAIDTPDAVRSMVKDFDILEILVDNVDDKSLPGLKSIEGVLGYFIADNKLRIMVKDHEQAFQRIFEYVSKLGGSVRSVNVSVPTLEEAFIQLTGRRA